MNITGICSYETPCGWCTKWDKKCDKKIGCENDNKLQRGLRVKGNFIDDPADAQVDITKLMKPKDHALQYIKSGQGLPPLNTGKTEMPGIRKETRG